MKPIILGGVPEISEIESLVFMARRAGQTEATMRYAINNAITEQPFNLDIYDPKRAERLINLYSGLPPKQYIIGEEIKRLLPPIKSRISKTKYNDKAAPPRLD